METIGLSREKIVKTALAWSALAEREGEGRMLTGDDRRALEALIDDAVALVGVSLYPLVSGVEACEGEDVVTVEIEPSGRLGEGVLRAMRLEMETAVMMTLLTMTRDDAADAGEIARKSVAQMKRLCGMGRCRPMHRRAEW